MRIQSMQYICIALLLFSFKISFAQVEKTNVPIFSADSLVSGNYKDILTSFYQLAISNLTGSNKELKFTSTPYAIMLKNDSTLRTYEKYRKSQLARRFNISIDARLDSAYHFDGFASGITYAIVNRRDYSLREDFLTSLKRMYNDSMFHRLYGVLGDNFHRDDSVWQVFDDTIRARARDQLDQIYPRQNKTLYSGLSDEYLTQEDTLNSIFLAHVVERSRIVNDHKILKNEKQVLESKNDKGKADEKLKILSNIAIDVKIGLDTVIVFDSLYSQSLRTFMGQMQRKLDVLWNDTTLTFDKVDKDLKTFIFALKDTAIGYLKKLTGTDPKIIVAKQRSKNRDSLIANFDKKGLWTFNVSDTSYSDGGLFKSVQLTTEFLKGIIQPSKNTNIELDLKAYVSYYDDTLKTGRNLLRQVLSLEPGINLVLKSGKTLQSFLEFKISGAYNNIIKGLYAKENQISNTINGTLRIRVFSDIWIPLTVKYDPKAGNVFGFLGVTTNFTDLSNLAKSQKKS